MDRLVRLFTNLAALLPNHLLCCSFAQAGKFADQGVPLTGNDTCVGKNSSVLNVHSKRVPRSSMRLPVGLCESALFTELVENLLVTVILRGRQNPFNLFHLRDDFPAIFFEFPQVAA